MDPDGSLNYHTHYVYDALDKLTDVYQSGTASMQTVQHRTVTYDSLGRLLTADNPEDSGSIGYAYDDNGNLLPKVDARGVAKCFYSDQTCSSGGTLGSNGYDALNRVAVVTYSDSTPSERYCYDGKVLSGTTCVTPSRRAEGTEPFTNGRCATIELQQAECPVKRGWWRSAYCVTSPTAATTARTSSCPTKTGAATSHCFRFISRPAASTCSAGVG